MVMNIQPIPFVPLMCIFFGHWVGDFVAQTEYMATNKSKSYSVLGNHVFTYMACMLGVIFLCDMNRALHVTPQNFFMFVCINFSGHFFTDAITSRITSELRKEERFHEFFVVIGLDQLIHMFTLTATAHLIM